MYMRSKKHRESPAIEVIGWYGMAAVVLAYGAVSLSYLPTSSLTYLTLNGTGSAALAYHSYVRKDNQPLVLNLIWLAIAGISLITFTASKL